MELELLQRQNKLLQKQLEAATEVSDYLKFLLENETKEVKRLQEQLEIKEEIEQEEE